MKRVWKMDVVKEARMSGNVNIAAAKLSGAGIGYRVTNAKPNVIRYWFTDYSDIEYAGEIEFPIK